VKAAAMKLSTFAFALAACFCQPAGAEEYLVEPRDVEDVKAVIATIEAVDTTRARARISGELEDLRIDEGSRVIAGEVIATVVDAKLPIKLSELDAKIEATRSQLTLARLEYDRIEKLRQSGTVSQARFDAAQTDLAVAQGQLAAAIAERATVARQLEEGAVLAPASGRVLRVEATQGMFILAGETVAIVAAETHVLRLSLPERHARFIGEGDTVRVGARGLSIEAKGLGTGTIRQVYPEIKNGRVVADVEVANLGDYYVGERTRVYVATGKRRTFTVPRDYLIRQFGLTYLRLKDAGDIVVQTGAVIADEVEILSGLRPGDTLVRP
jgi:RND family efflux transporter MFP subunit